MYSPKPANGLSKRSEWTLRFAHGLSVLRKIRIFGEILSSPTDDFGGSKMRRYRVGRIFVGVPVFALGVCVFTFDWSFLLWAVNNHPNKKPSRIAIRLCARCALGEGR